jgi:Cu2+-exporting ATPase
LFAALSIPDPDGTFAASVAASRPTGIATMGHALAERDLVPIPLSRASYRKMLQNLGWAAGYNVLVIPLAAGVHARAGLTLSPAVGTILKSASTITVALNAQTLRRVDLPQPLAA